MTDTLTTPEDFEPLFDELWLALGPKERTEYAERMRVYHRHLRDIRVASIRVGISRTIQTARMKVLPPVGEIRTHALEHAASLQRAMRHVGHDRPEVPATHCACRCGGRRWHKLLRDPVTNAVRLYPADIARQAAVPDVLDRSPRFAQLLEALAGQPILRTFVACTKSGVHPEPAPAHYLGLEDGCPVYDPDRLDDARQEAA